MTDRVDTAARRARRLLACYPPAWRARYGEEFTQLLLDDMCERPRSIVRTADVIRSGLLARLANAGVIADMPQPEQQVRAGLAALALAVSAFLAFGVAIWSQLTIGWQWSAPEAPGTNTAMVVMSAVIGGFAVLALLAAIPLVWALARTLIRGEGRVVAAPVIAAALGLLLLVVGSVHFGHGWPGTGGHPWSGRDIVPGAVARFAWAATLWVSSYWAHPGALATFPASEIAWMVASPVALLAVLIGTAKVIRRLPLSPRILRYESWLGMGCVVAMAGFLAGAGSWVISGGAAPRGLFRVGAIDSIGVVVMGGALIVAFRAGRRAVSADPQRAPTH